MFNLLDKIYLMALHILRINIIRIVNISKLLH